MNLLFFEIFNNIFKDIQIYIIIFLLGLLGIFTNKKNLIMILLSVEILICSINLMFIHQSYISDDLIGQIFVLIILTVASAEASIILAIIILTYRLKGNIFIKNLNNIKG